MINESISATLQLGVFTLIPLLVWLIFHRRKERFLQYIGLKKSPRKPLLLAFAISLVNIIPFLVDLSFLRPVIELMKDSATVTGKFYEMGLGIDTFIQITIIAFAKTAFAEEILFRGFIAKRLISGMGFIWGNIMQAIIFGAVHLFLFMTITDNPISLVYAFLMPALVALIAVWLNEKMAGGSIWPGWVAHGFGNFFTYMYFAIS